MQKVSNARNEHDEWWGVHWPIEGDLVGMSYLYFEKKFLRKEEYSFPRVKAKNNVNLVLSGDSYTVFVPDSAFGVGSYKYGRRYFSELKFELDSNKKNILIFEIAERYVKDYFSSNRVYNEVALVNAPKQEVKQFFPVPGKDEPQKSKFDEFMSVCFNPLINQNLEYNLFNYNVVNPVRKAKAWMNYHLFSRASGDVIVADDGEYLFLKETVNKKNSKSSFSEFTDAEVSQLIRNLNAVSAHYKALGFDEVYLSIIPNPVTVLQPAGYNGLIPRIQNSIDLKIRIIDMYSVFKNTKDVIYWKGDTHWNNNGVNVWLKEVNKILQADSL
ncbi:MAG: hypothetical protein JST82_11510 [Bacteroidetes bacterium]|nr:hypothetical protein [Bacteroidota bacterium]